MWRGVLLLLVALGSAWLGFGDLSEARKADDGVSWESLDLFRHRVPGERFVRTLKEVYAPEDRWKPWIQIDECGASIARDATGSDTSSYYLPFGEPDGGPERIGAGKGLRGVRIALDPGHIGGAWAVLEERSFRIGEKGPRVQEGDLTLAVAVRLRERLAKLGAEVWLTRETAEPVTSRRPNDFLEVAASRLAGKEGLAGDAFREAQTRLAARMFYRTSEIKARAARMNREFRPDLALVLHLNAVAWPDPESPSLVEQNDGHVIVHGCYLPHELKDDEARLQMVHRLSKGYHEIERAIALEIANAMVETTGLAPYRYKGENALKLDEAGYVWARNLLANRVYDCPVVYLEPWTLNSEAVYHWASLGDYEGERVVGGAERRSLPAVYADFVVDGLLRYFREL